MSNIRDRIPDATAESSVYNSLLQWRSGRVVEGGTLLRCYTSIRGIEGSNPSSSALSLRPFAGQTHSRKTNAVEALSSPFDTNLDTNISSWISAAFAWQRSRVRVSSGPLLYSLLLQGKSEVKTSGPNAHYALCSNVERLHKANLSSAWQKCTGG